MTNTPTEPKTHDPLLRLRNIIGPYGILPVSRSTFYALVAAGKIPKACKLSARISAWRESDILAYIASAEADDAGR
ncbi:AlpA family transcriptional regulator [Paracoccus sp. S1E-3]|uniref:helix-turn-helix transcriptional regulator n=1 Tax=Paracoccus sp. S1E-3 TaxID=2756130 RepID=UPI0015EE6A9A|nr:AlpA family phage regulatory protein [Paracoccus sp. S1E-3]MBA4492105.1 AlpA family phage regulatory protein [Paracoccus sp. S1E-3]